MKTTKAIFGILITRTSQTFAMTEPLSGRQPVLALLVRLLWAASLVLPDFVAQAGVVLTTLHSFQVSPNGEGPAAGLVQGRDGNFYGTTSSGGTNGGAGTVFKISPTGALTSLYSFTGVKDGASPGGLVQGTDGNFYGTTEYSGYDYATGCYGYGTIFKISPNGALASLHSFSGNDGWGPNGLVQGSDGNFYGTTYYGGQYGLVVGGYGTVFKISTNGAYTDLYFFTGGNDGARPYAGLAQGSDGNFYGTTYQGGANKMGTVFKISANGALTSLYSFTGGTDGVGPNGLAQGSNGSFYGTTSSGGANNFGTVFKISTNGALTNLHSFTGGTDGANPLAGLVQGTDGDFYGTTPRGGTNNFGTVFKISTNGALTNLHSFTGGADGEYPYAGLVQGSDGNFYGTTSSGGQGNAGTVFRLTGLTVVRAAPVFQAVTLASRTLSLTWSTEAGGRYQLQYTSDLKSSNWTNLGSAATATGATLSATDSVTPSPRRFYRVVLLP